MQNTLEASRQAVFMELCLISGDELAKAVGFAGANDSFRHWCKRCGIEPVPGRKSHFDPKLVRMRLDEIQGLKSNNQNNEPVSLVEQRRARLASH